MLAFMTLVVYSLAAGIVAPKLVNVCHRNSDSPRFELATWLLLVASWVISVVSVGLIVVAGSSQGHGLAGLLHACRVAVTDLITVQDWSQLPATVALVYVCAFVLRIIAVTIGQVWRTHRDRQRYRHIIRGLAGARSIGGFDVFTVPSTRVAAYCLPGRPAAIVLTRAAEERLPRHERVAVLAHEMAHLHGRHHLYVAFAVTMHRAFPFVPLLRHAATEVSRLVERIADDQAGKRHGRRTVAEAITTMALSGHRSSASPAALHATGSDVPNRVKRLLRPEDTTSAAGYRAILAALILPILALGAAAIAIGPSATADPPPACMSTDTGVSDR
ncbi:MAG TPA: M48 family metalloprotease [Candidatus Stackebrandtia faecavium]|nr:M48 family metalloprotease [Candidatus Stackebrandtia faecavium]